LSFHRLRSPPVPPPMTSRARIERLSPRISFKIRPCCQKFPPGLAPLHGVSFFQVLPESFFSLPLKCPFQTMGGLLLQKESKLLTLSSIYKNFFPPRDPRHTPPPSPFTIRVRILSRKPPFTPHKRIVPVHFGQETLSIRRSYHLPFCFF